MSHSDYMLSAHAYLCRAGDQLIFMDLRRNQYFALNTRLASELQHLLRGWPRSADLQPDEHAAIEDETRALVDRLLQMGLITATTGSGKDARPLQLAIPTIPLVEEHPRDASTVPWRYVHAFIASSVKAACMLRWRDIETVVNTIRRRKERHRGSRCPDLTVARELVAAFRDLRPFVFTARNQCLFHSVALLEFLAWQDVLPTWVFGVRISPFGAHCWIQEGEVVFNDHPEHVRLYTPIMAV